MIQMKENELISQRYNRILKLLDQERSVILKGPLSQLRALVDQREAAMSEILADEATLPEAFLTALKARAERNSRLLLASIAGVRSATDQIERIQSAQENLRTYSPDGQPVDVRQTQVTRDKRA